MAKQDKKIVSINNDINNANKIIMEETKKTVANLLGQAVKEYMNESVINEADDDNEFEVVNDGDKVEDTEETSTEETSTEETPTDDDSLEVEPESSETSTIDIEGDESEEGDKWGEFDNFKTNDEEYDFSGSEDDETIIKVFKLLSDDDQVIFKQNGNSFELKDNETGAEYKIETGANCKDASCEDSNSDSLSDEDEEDEDSLFEINLSKLNKILKEDLGFTDDYQSKDSIEGLSMDNSNLNGVNDWHKGVPTGTTKPWGNQSDGQPFDETVEIGANETGEDGVIDEITSVTSSNARKMSKTHTSTTREKYLPHGSKTISVGGEYKGSVSNESVIKKAKIVYENYKKALVKIEEIQKDYKEALSVIGKAQEFISEATLVNVNLGKVVKLMMENTTSKDEKLHIINRFSNEAKTVEQSKVLYESIKNELSKNNSGHTQITTDKSISTPKQQISETKIYQSQDVNNMIDLMNRIGKY